MPFRSRMITSRRKTAVDWTGPLDKYNHREDQKAADQIARELAQMIPQMLKKIPVKGFNLYEYVHQHGGLKGLIGQTDPELKKAYYQFRSQLEQLLKDTDDSQLNRFYNEYGKNPLDWNFVKTSGKLVTAKKARKVAAHTDKLIDVPVGTMRDKFESDFSGDERNTETDHKDDKFAEKNLPKGASAKKADAFKDTLGEKIIPVVADGEDDDNMVGFAASTIADLAEKNPVKHENGASETDYYGAFVKVHQDPYQYGIDIVDKSTAKEFWLDVADLFSDSPDGELMVEFIEDSYPSEEISEGDDWASRAKGLLGSHNQQLDEVVFDWLNGIAENGIAGANKEDTIALCRHYDGVNDMLPEDIFDFTVEVADELGIEDEELA